MRYLNKIIFLQSANIPYAEVRLDGNVHFIGTQGVGKSTVLRALLFFYNADKLRLGIPKEKKPFDAFYFPKDNSYMVYEVMRENGAYCVLAQKSQGRVAFRFIDAPYSKKWFIDEQNRVYPLWTDIRAQLGKNINPSALVTSYEMFRDIIFGNNRRQELIPFRKYAIVESAKYQNIPRTIQNVFLNTKLDADFIKNTIISSMSDEDVSIDLNFYREQIKGFEQEYNDVSLWTTKNRNGEVIVRRLADKVTEAYHALLYNRKQIQTMRQQLNYAERMAQEQLPQYRNDISETKTEHERIVRLANEEDTKHTKEHTKLSGDIAVIDDRLKRTSEKRNHYESIAIEEICHRVSREPAIEEEKHRQETLKADLEKSCQSIVDKYRMLLEKLEVDMCAFTTDIDRQRNEHQAMATRAKEEFMSELRKADDEVRTAFAKRIQMEHDGLIQIEKEITDTKIHRIKIDSENPFAKETEDCKLNLQQLRERERLIEVEIKAKQTRIKGLEKEAQLEEEKLSATQNAAILKINNRKSQIAEEKESINNLLQRSKGSLAEWLDGNMNGWQDTIGRIADEETVLYNDQLCPQLDSCEGAATIYGVKLDLSSVERKFRTPEELKALIAEKDTAYEAARKEHERLREQHEAEKDALHRKYASLLCPLRDELRMKEIECHQIPLQIKNAQVELNAVMKKLDEWREAQHTAIEQQLGRLADKKIKQDEALQRVEAEQAHRLQALQGDYNKKVRETEAEQKQFEKELNLHLAEKRKQTADSKEQLIKLQQKELKGKKVDVTALQAYEKRIAELTAELHFIRKHRETVFAYNKDKTELFDTETLTRQEKKRLTDALALLDDKYHQRKERLDMQKRLSAEQLDRQRKALEALEQGLKEAASFRCDATLNPPGVDNTGEKSTTKDCHSIVESLKSLIYNDIKALTDFKRKSQEFLGKFSPKNTFSFNTQPVTEEEFFGFASNLCEFVENDKIEEYKKEISSRYTFIINRISKEAGDITHREGSIRKTIEEINRDFQERNFAGVIKEIALRQQSSTDQLMQLLLRIKEFNDEHLYDMGEMDMFSTANRDEVNDKAVKYLSAFMKGLLDEPNRKTLQIADTFRLEFRVKENDNDTGWVEKIANVGSDGTDILVKAMVNIMLINVFKEKASKKFGDFKIHCMMDEIGKLHPNNVKGILDFANRRNIMLVNSSPTTYNVEDYRYTYLLNKDNRSNTQIVQLVRKI